MSDKLIELINVSVKVGNRFLLNKVNLTLNKGDRLSIFGISGSGKTTILKVISGILPVSEGEVRLHGNKINDVVPGAITTVWQSRALFPHLNVEENIRFGLNLQKKLDKEQKQNQFHKYVDLLQISHLLKRKVNNLSGGESQKVALARALVVEPQLLLLDEPFTGIDNIFREELREELRYILDRAGCTYILVSHDLDDVYSLTDRAVFLEGGKFIQEGALKDLELEPASYSVAKAFGNFLMLEGTITQFDQDYLTIVTDLGEFQAVSKGINTINKKVYFGVHLGKVQMSNHLSPSGPSLKVTVNSKKYFGEDVFISLMFENGSFTRVKLDIRQNGINENENIFLNWDTENAIVIPHKN